MAASCEETSDGSGFQRAQKRGSDRIQLVRRSGFSELLKKLPTACQTDRWATGDPVSSEKSSRLLTVCGTIMVQWALKELPIAHRLLGDRRFNEFWKSYRSLTVGGMIGGSVCSKKEALIAYRLHADCIQIACRLHTDCIQLRMYESHIFELRIKTWMKVILAVMSTTWAVVKIRPEKNSGLYGIWTHDLWDTGAALYQLS